MIVFWALGLAFPSEVKELDCQKSSASHTIIKASVHQFSLSLETERPNLEVSLCEYLHTVLFTYGRKEKMQYRNFYNGRERLLLGKSFEENQNWTSTQFLPHMNSGIKGRRENRPENISDAKWGIQVSQRHAHAGLKAGNPVKQHSESF